MRIQPPALMPILRSRHQAELLTELAPQYCSISDVDGVNWWAVGLGPAAVVCSFDMPAGVFAFDDAWVGPGSSLGEEPADEFADGMAPQTGGGVRGVRGEKRWPLRFMI